jgi:hypothetical protein
LLSARPPTYPWPPEQRSQLSQHPDALQSVTFAGCSRAYAAVPLSPDRSRGFRA